MAKDPREMVPITVELFVPGVEGRAAFRTAHRSVEGGLAMPPGGGSIDIRIVVDDVDALYRLAREGGVAIAGEIADRDYGLRDFIIEDPDGFRLRFASPAA